MTFKIANMLHPEVFDHPVTEIKLIETHISWVILTGDLAYKIKKPVDFGFLDFSTLKKRQRYCEQELHLNRRLAAGIYLDIVTITGTADEPRIAGSGGTLEYAVKMTQFPQSAQLDNMLLAGQLKAEHMDAIARMVADFHHTIEVADNTVEYGDSKLVYYPVEENFTQINQHIDTTPYSSTLNHLKQWSRSVFNKREKNFTKRKQDGFIRECHGDMHLRNMLWLDGQAMAFDCIEFNDTLRWIDVISEVAFLVMDLQDRKQYPLANRFLNAYLEITGDYAGLSTLPFYLTYRAMVRAKVNALRLEQKSANTEEDEQARAAFESYLKLAATYTQQAKPQLIIMRGLSASGKSTVSQQLVDSYGAIRIRSDVERKRIFEVNPAEDAGDKIDQGIYTSKASQQTYTRLQELCTQIIDAGFSVVIDAAFLKHEQRAPFQLLAERLAVRFTIIEITAPAEILRQRIIEREHDVSDANLAVLEHQLANYQPLLVSEQASAITVNTAEALDVDHLLNIVSER